MRLRTTAIAAVAVLAGGLTAFAAPAYAATGPTVTLERGLVTITGTAARDVIGVRMDANGLVVDFGDDGTVDAQIQRSRYQRVRVLAGEGDDGVGVTGTGDVPVTISGGAGNDGIGIVGHIGERGTDDAPTTISGDAGDDNIFAATPGLVTILAGAGDDRVDGDGGGIGQQVVSLGEGNDRFVSSLNAFVGARHDDVDGGPGQDIMEVQGTFATESVGLSASKGRLIVDHELRDQIVAANVEDVSYIGFGGNDESGDAVVVNDLSGTGVARFTADFSAGRGDPQPNNSADTLTVRGTPGADHIAVSGAKANVLVSGLTPVVAAVNLRPEDFLLIDTLAGDDVVDSSGLQPGLVQLLVR